MLSIRKLQQSNRVLRGSGKELLALASPNLPNLASSRLAASSSLCGGWLEAPRGRRRSWGRGRCRRIRRAGR